MLCQNCGETAHRSHSRNFRESFIKKATPYKIYRCHACGWRGMARPSRRGNRIGELKTIAVWIVGLLLALAMGIFGADLLP